MKVKMYTESSIKGPAVKDAKWGSVVEFTRADGIPVTRERYGAEEKTTWNRTTLIAVVEGMKILIRPCEVEVITDNQFVANMINGGNVERWKRQEWKKPSGKDIAQKELWQEFARLAAVHKVWATIQKENEYSKYMKERMKGHV